MKKPGSEIGNLSARFFAYAQLKRKEIVRTGELISILGITPSQERNLLSRLSKSGWIVRLKRGLYLVPPRIPAGGKYSPGVAMILKKLIEEEDGTYQICGPTAFNYYGLDEQVPNITYIYNNRISGSRTIGKLTFQFIKVKDTRLGSTNSIRTVESLEMIYSTKVRTLMDAVYDWSRFNSLPKGYDWIRQEIRNNPRSSKEFVDVVVRYGNQATTRRIGYLLEISDQPLELLEKLNHNINESSALISWIPGKSAQGKINRKWGIIVNG